VARAPYRLRELIPREHPRQAAIAKTLTIEIARAGHLSPAGVVWFAVDHADFAGAVPAARVGRGIIAGIPDIWVLWLGCYYVIEIKADDGEVAAPQQEVIVAMARNGGRIAVARDWREVLLVLDQWQIPRARRVREAA
jgi:hypothetical protein